jgi:tetratricopeptide (TPR) repeat protein
MLTYFKRYIRRDEMESAPHDMLLAAALGTGLAAAALGVHVLLCGTPETFTLLLAFAALCCVDSFRTAFTNWRARFGNVVTSGMTSAALGTAQVLCFLAAVTSGYKYLTADDLALIARAQHLRVAGSPGRAASTLTSVLERNSDAKKAYEERALAYEASRKFREAFADRAQVVRLASDLDNRIRALEAYRNSIHNCPDQDLQREVEPVVCSDLIEALLKRNRYEDVDRVIAVLPPDSGDGLSFVYRGLLREKQSWGKGIDEFNQAMRVNPKQHLAFWAKSYLLSRSITKEDQGNPFRQYRPPELDKVGRAFLQNQFAGREVPVKEGIRLVADEAIRLARTGCELTDWREPNCLVVLAFAEAQVGHYSEAAKWQKKALEFTEFRQRHGDKARTRLEGYEKGYDLLLDTDLGMPELPPVRGLYKQNLH